MVEKWFREDKEYKSLFKLNKKDVILDIGTGFTAAMAVQAAAKVKKVFGADICPIALKEAVKHIQSKKIINIELIKVEGTKLPFTDEYFDRVIIKDVFQGLIHDEMPRRMLQSILRILKPSGYLYILAYKFSCRDKLWNMKEWKKRISGMGFEEVSVTSIVDSPDGADRMLISARKNGCTSSLVKASETGDVPIYSNSGSIPAAEKPPARRKTFRVIAFETNKTKTASGGGKP